MARLNQDQPQTKAPQVNIAGDFTTEGLDVSPDDQQAIDRDMQSIEPRDQQALTPADAKHMREQREKTKRETAKGTSSKQRTMGAESGGGLVNPSSDRNANTDWPTDE